MCQQCPQQKHFFRSSFISTLFFSLQILPFQWKIIIYRCRPFVANDLVINVLCERVGFVPVTNEPKQSVCVKYRNTIYVLEHAFPFARSILHLIWFDPYISICSVFTLNSSNYNLNSCFFAMRHTQNFGNIWKYFHSFHRKSHRRGENYRTHKTQQHRQRKNNWMEEFNLVLNRFIWWVRRPRRFFVLFKPT